MHRFRIQFEDNKQESKISSENTNTCNASINNTVILKSDPIPSAPTIPETIPEMKASAFEAKHSLEDYPSLEPIVERSVTFGASPAIIYPNEESSYKTFRYLYGVFCTRTVPIRFSGLNILDSNQLITAISTYLGVPISDVTIIAEPITSCCGLFKDHFNMIHTIKINNQDLFVSYNHAYNDFSEIFKVSLETVSI